MPTQTNTPSSSSPTKTVAPTKRRAAVTPRRVSGPSNYNKMTTTTATQSVACAMSSSSSATDVAAAAAAANAAAAATDSFPLKLHRLLMDAEQKGDDDVVGWNEQGTAFSIYQPKVFAETWMKKYFLQTRYKSFQRQCNLYNFERTTLGKIKGHCK
jgi:HSF-type DNA-binding